jgi:hypothetical protein
MMHGTEKSDARLSATKSANKAGQPEAEPMEPKASNRGEHEPDAREPDAAPGNRGTCTAK